MRREILMPSVSPSMTAGRIARWHVSEGQSVAAGDVLAEVATSSATIEIEAENEGRVERILVPAGTDGVKVNTPIAIFFGQPQKMATSLSFASFAIEATPPVDKPDARLQTSRPEKTMREALRDTLAAEMRADDSVFVIGFDVTQNRGAPRVTQGLADEFGDKRVVSVPALDEATFGLAVGAAMAGLKPVVELTSWGRSLDTLWPHLITAAQTFYLSGGRLPVPIVFRGPNGFNPGFSGEASRCVASALAQLPGLKVVQPSDPITASALLQAALHDRGPVAVLEHELLYASSKALGTISGEAENGKARIVRPGRDATLVAAGRAVSFALEAADRLARDAKHDIEVIDLMSVRPLDHATIAASVTRTGRLATVEEGWGDVGIGAEIVATAVGSPLFKALKAPPRRIAGAAVPMPYAQSLEEQAIPDSARVAAEVTALISGA